MRPYYSASKMVWVTVDGDPDIVVGLEWFIDRNKLHPAYTILRCTGGYSAIHHARDAKKIERWLETFGAERKKK